MTPNRTFRFMTGVHSYRIQAVSREEALAYAVHALQADENLARVIESTLYEEGAEQVFAAPSAESSKEATVYPFRREVSAAASTGAPSSAQEQTAPR